jgi:hypothetical protein
MDSTPQGVELLRCLYDIGTGEVILIGPRKQGEIIVAHKPLGEPLILIGINRDGTRIADLAIEDIHDEMEGVGIRIGAARFEADLIELEEIMYRTKEFEADLIEREEIMYRTKER